MKGWGLKTARVGFNCGPRVTKTGAAGAFTNMRNMTNKHDNSNAATSNVEWFKEDLELNLTNEEIKSLSKNKLKKIIKSKTKEAALKSIIQLQGNKETGKMCHIKYNKLTTMTYLESPLFTQDESSLLLRLRTRCVNSIRNDFGGMYFDKKLPS